MHVASKSINLFCWLFADKKNVFVQFHPNMAAEVCTEQRPHLCMFEGVHNEDGKSQSKDVSQKTGVEICPAVFLQAVTRGGQVKTFTFFTFFFKSEKVETDTTSDGKNRK